MAILTFAKALTANDTGLSGGHQAGIHIPKSQVELIRMLPPLNPKVKNPDAWLECIDDDGRSWKFRYIYYNNSLHDPSGTRDEYRITHMTKFFRLLGGDPGDQLMLSGEKGAASYRISVVKKPAQPETSGAGRVRLQGWHRVH
jgi:Restriction endonuclease EcoRII, N-terminal